METVNQFIYTYENLSLYQFWTDYLMFLWYVIFGIILMYGLYQWLFLSALQVVSYHNKLALAKKKRTLSDLILMKDIQTELEKEIEQAILKAAFHS